MKGEAINPRKIVSVGLALGALLAGALAIWSFADDRPSDAVVEIVGGAICLWVAIWNERPKAPDPGGIRRRLMAVGVIFLVTGLTLVGIASAAILTSLTSGGANAFAAHRIFVFLLGIFGATVGLRVIRAMRHTKSPGGSETVD